MADLDAEGPRRLYRAPRRLQAAQQTRLRIRAAARDHFLADGYAATAVRDIAQTAGVAEKTVYLQFATKSALLRAVVQAAVDGGDEPDQPPPSHPRIEIAAETGTALKMRRVVSSTSAFHERTGAVFAMARGAAAVDPDAAELWDAGKQIHRADMTLLAGYLEKHRLLPAGHDVGWATATLFVLLGPETWQLVRHDLRAEEDGYREWLLGNLDQLFPAAFRQPSTD
jgi:AcrR family transcriptional regulator